MSLKIVNNVYWVGKTDWELRKFHGDEYSTHRGSTYNSYLIKEAKTDKNDVITGVFKSKAILMGSPTINRGILVSVAGILEEIKGLQFKNKKAAAFGCYGWSGESTKIVSDGLRSAGFEVVHDGLKVLWNPDPDVQVQCVEFGRQVAASID